MVTDAPADPKKVWATLALFLLVIEGIYSGVFTPTEAAGFGAVGALIIGVVRRRLDLGQILALVALVIAVPEVVTILPDLAR